MQVLFKSRHPQATDLRNLAESHVRFMRRHPGCLVTRLLPLFRVGSSDQ